MNIRISIFFLVISLALTLGVSLAPSLPAHAAAAQSEPVNACVPSHSYDLSAQERAQIAACLGWMPDPARSLCAGFYRDPKISLIKDANEVRIKANQASFSQSSRSELQGAVEVQQGQRVVNAQTAYLYRDNKTGKIERIELLGRVRYFEPGRLMLANKATLYPTTKAGSVEGVLYRFDLNRRGALLPAWGRAALVERFPNQDYLLQKATYSQCAPQDKAWELRAKEIRLNHAEGKGSARDATLYLRNMPVFYVPYMTFPTNKERKSGLLTPVTGYSNVGGYDLALPLYLNLAPNYDATLIPHLYTRRGMMMGGEFRYLTEQSIGVFDGNILPQDKAYQRQLNNYSQAYPWLKNDSTNRWFLRMNDTTSLAQNLQFNLNFQQVSDAYYLQDFSSNLAAMTERQLLRQADLSYTTDHWYLRGLAQSYQTINPLNLTPVDDIYERLPQVMARGYYADLPAGLTFDLAGLYDQFHWPSHQVQRVQGPRWYLNPILSLPMRKPWGYLTPSVQVVETYYDVQQVWPMKNQSFNRFIPRFSVDSGLYFERGFGFDGSWFTQTLEPRLFYLNVPFSNQTALPVYDSAYMIFNADQLFRFNRFSGYDRIGDANQLTYALTTRFLDGGSGFERASLTLGQIHYFANRQVKLCTSQTGYCYEDPLTLGFLSLDASNSPLASRMVFHIDPVWSVVGDYVWDPASRATNNSDVNLHYQPAPDKLVSVGYSYLVNGDITEVAGSGLEQNALNQLTFAYAWPFTEHWSTLGVYSYNMSKGFSMMSVLGIQYDSCCWAMRVLGGQSFKSLDNQLRPQYNNNFYLQILLKGLGGLASSDPYYTINSYLPTYRDSFHR